MKSDSHEDGVAGKFRTKTKGKITQRWRILGRSKQVFGQTRLYVDYGDENELK